MEIVANRGALERRVLGLDDAVGIVREGQSYAVVLGGNEAEEAVHLPGAVLASILGPEVVTTELTDLGRTASPFGAVAGIVLAIMTMIIGGVLIGFNISTLIGLYVGGVSSNQIEGIGLSKLGIALFVWGPVIGAVIPERFRFALYWIPTYWTYRGLRGILIDGTSWPEVIRLAGVNLLVVLAVLALLWNLLRQRLTIGG